MIDVIKFILENQIVADGWAALSSEISALLADHDKLIRTLAMYVSEDKAGKGDERRNLMGVYYDEVQEKVTWAYNTAKDVWAGKYPNGVEKRREVFGDDFDLVQYWVNALKPAGIYQPDNLSASISNGRYTVPNVVTAKGTKTFVGFCQRKQGTDAYRLPGSGCGLCSYTSLLATYVDSSITPLKICQTKLIPVTGFSACPISISAGAALLKHYGISSTRVKTFDTDSAYKDIKAHLLTGKPVVISLSCRNRKGVKTDRYTYSGHYVLLVGIRKDGKVFIMDSGVRNPRWADLWDVCDHIPVNSANGNSKQTWVWCGEGGYYKINP